MRPHAKSWRGISCNEQLHLEPRDRRKLHRQVGEQDHLLHGHRVWVGHLESMRLLIGGPVVVVVHVDCF